MITVLFISLFILIFYPRDAMLARVFAIATCPSVRPQRAGIVRKRCILDTKLLWDGNRKPYASYRMTSLSMTLNGHYALCFKTRASFGAHHENLNEDRLHYQRRRCSPITLDSDNVRFMRIFAVVPCRGGVKRQWCNQKRRFSGLSEIRTLRLRHPRK